MKTTELENTSMNVEEQTNKNYSSLEFTNVENSPFTIVREENQYFGLIGLHRITEKYDDIEELKEDLLKFSWDRVAQVIWAVVEKFKHSEEEIKNLVENEQ